MTSQRPTTGQSGYWFHAKRYGWGWGLPARREGWIVLLTWLIVVTTGSAIIASYSLPWFFAFMFVMTAIFLAICYAKGEPPRWRWGESG